MTIRDTYLDTAAAAIRLIGAPSIRQRWTTPSALPGMSVGELAAHLARSVLQVAVFLGQDDPRSADPVSAQAHYGDLEGADDLDSPLNQGVRERSRQVADSGPDGVLAQVTQSLGTVRERLTGEQAERQLLVFGDQAMWLDEYLRTRLVEFAVHLDDLGAEVPDGALREAIAVLVAAARHRHGDLAVLRALARRERDPVEALRVL